MNSNDMRAEGSLGNPTTDPKARCPTVRQLRPAIFLHARTSSRLPLTHPSQHTYDHTAANGSSDALVHLLYSLDSEIYSATSAPYTCPSHAYVTSIPAEIPDDVQIFPSSTHRAVCTQLTLGPVDVAQAHERLLVVACFPSRMPARARIVAPVQMEIMYLT
jgi:hypothetical protein